MKFNFKSIAVKVVTAIIIFFLARTLTLNVSEGDIYTSFINKMIVFLILGVFLILPKYLDVLVTGSVIILIRVYHITQEVYLLGFNQYYRLKMVYSLRKELIDVMDSATELTEMVDVSYILISFTVLLIIVSIFIQILWVKKSGHVIQYIPFLVVGIIIINLGFASFSEFEQILESEKDANHQFVYYQTDHFVYENKYNIVEYVEKFGLNTLLINDVEEYFVSNKVNGTHDKFVELDSFFTNREVKTNNDFTGLFKDKSLLLIEAESLSKMAISEELTPTLFKMMTEGMNFTGFDTPLLFGSTSDTEFMANTSIYPHSDGEVTFYNYAENSYPNSLPNKFIENGYSAISFHNHYPEFYNRDMMHNALGYQEFFVPIKMGIPAPSSDLTVLEKVKWILIPDQRFFSFFVTFNGHQPYDIELPESYQKYLDKVYEVYPDISNEYAVYLAKNMELDEAIQILIYNLIDNGRGNDVVLAVFGDHEPKGLVGEGLEEFLTVTNQTNDDNRTPFFIWSNDVEKLEIDKTSTALDILPTIFNLFEISYESDKVFGHDLLSDDYLGFSFTSTGEISGSSKSIEEYLNERKLSNWILELDYFIEKDFVIVD